MAPPRVLVVDDEPGYLFLLQEWLTEDGHEVYTATGGVEALRVFSQRLPNLTIADLRMPGMDGFQLIGCIRKMSDAMVLALTALSTEEQIIRGLELGADEYLVKPVPKSVLLARVRSLLRRSATLGQPAANHDDPVLTVNPHTHEVWIRGQSLHLRPTEFRLLSLLMENSDRVVGHQELLDRVWGDEASSRDSLKWYISSLREKLEENPRDPRLILTVQTVGYRYCPPGRPY